MTVYIFHGLPAWVHAFLLLEKYILSPFNPQAREINHDGAEEGFAVVIELERAVNMRGKSIR